MVERIESKDAEIYIYDGHDAGGLPDVIQKNFLAVLNRVQETHEDRIQKILTSHREQNHNRIETLLAASEERIIQAVSQQSSSSQSETVSGPGGVRPSDLWLLPSQSDFNSASSMETERGTAAKGLSGSRARVTFRARDFSSDSSQSSRPPGLRVSLPEGTGPRAAGDANDTGHNALQTPSSTSINAAGSKQTQHSMQSLQHSYSSIGSRKSGWGKLKDRFTKSAGPVVLNPFRPDFSALALIQSRPMEVFVCLLIILNASSIATEADWRMKNTSEKTPSEFSYFESFFLFMFTIELILRVWGEKWEFVTFSNPSFGWNAFDTFLVVLGWLEEIYNRTTDTTAPDMSTLRILRICRLVRIIRIVRVMRFFRDLRLMVSGIASSLSSLMWCLLLLFMIMFTFGIVVMQVAADDLAEKDGKDAETDTEQAQLVFLHFGSLMRTIYTLYASICGGIDWDGVAEPLFHIHPIMGFLFVIYIAFAVFCVLNIVTGIFVENANKLGINDDDSLITEEVALRRQWTDTVQFLIRSSDWDGDGNLDWQEFRKAAKNPEVQAYFRRIGLNLEKEGVRALFQLLDFDGQGTVDIEEFVLGCSSLRGNARSLDLARLRHDNRLMALQITDLCELCKRTNQFVQYGIAQSGSSMTRGAPQRLTAQSEYQNVAQPLQGQQKSESFAGQLKSENAASDRKKASVRGVSFPDSSSLPGALSHPPYEVSCNEAVDQEQPSTGSGSGVTESDDESV